MPADFSALDRPEVLMFLFHPRREYGPPPGTVPDNATKVPGVQDVLIPVENSIAVGARLHLSGRAHANILFFHGNGEIAADYDEIAPFFNRMEINFLAADYRGYGLDGTPHGQRHDAGRAFDLCVRHGLALRNGFTGPVILMGRSLGSASAIELAAAYPDRVAGLIVESGFALAEPLLRLLGADPAAFCFREETTFAHLAKIARFRQPTLIIHAEFDHIIPFADGQALYDAAGAADKTLLKVPVAPTTTTSSRTGSGTTSKPSAAWPPRRNPAE